tara:strand:+ start:12972 stop:13217 length:246 start_codon:yes stop_codon:yes gene_type:complete
MATSTGVITGDTIVRPAGSRGVVTYSEASSAVAAVFDGIDDSGVKLLTLAIGDKITLDHPIEFKNGLFVKTTSGSTILHIG